MHFECFNLTFLISLFHMKHIFVCCWFLLYPTVLRSAVKYWGRHCAIIWCEASQMSSYFLHRIFIITTAETIPPALAFEDCPCQHNKLTIYRSGCLERNPFRTWDLPLRSVRFKSIHHICRGEGTAGRTRRCFRTMCCFFEHTSVLQPHNDLQCLRAQHANCP